MDTEDQEFDGRIRIEPQNSMGDLVYVTVELHQCKERFADCATIGVWVNDTDSNAELQARAHVAAKSFLERALKEAF